MKSRIITEACVGLAILFAACAVAGQLPAAKRKPLVPPPDQEAKSKPTGFRFRLDPATHQRVEYALEGKITFDQGAENYVLEWNGMDGERKKLIWTPPNKIRAEVVGRVSYYPEERLFRYTYDVSSLAESRQKLQSFYVTSPTEIVTGGNPDQTWYSSAFTPYLKRVFKVEDGWAWSQTMKGKLGLEPRQSAEGFNVVTVAVPGIVACYVRGQTDALRSSEEIPEELMEAIDQMAWKVPHGVTIGPGSPPDRLTPQGIAESLLRFLDVGKKQGWILDGSDASAIKQVAEGIGRAVSLGDSAEVVRLSDEGIDLVDHAYERGEFLSEARGLFIYNLAALKQGMSKVGALLWHPIPGNLDGNLGNLGGTWGQTGRL